MVDHPRLAFGPGGLAVHSGSRRPARQAARMNARRVDRSGALAALAPQSPPGLSRPRLMRRRGRHRHQIFPRINRFLAAAQFEMKLRLADISGRPDPGDHLAAGDLLPGFDQDHVAMGIGGDETVGMLDQDQIAVAAHLVAGIGDNAAVGGLDRRAARRGDVNAVIARAIGSGAKTFDDAALHRPQEFAAAAGGASGASGCGGVVAATGGGSGAALIGAGASGAELAEVAAGAAGGSGSLMASCGPEPGVAVGTINVWPTRMR